MIFSYLFFLWLGITVGLLGAWTVFVHYFKKDEMAGPFVREYLQHRPELLPAYCPECTKRAVQKLLEGSE